MKYFNELNEQQQETVLNKLVPMDNGCTLDMFIPTCTQRKKAVRDHLTNSTVCMFDEKLCMYAYAGEA